MELHERLTTNNPAGSPTESGQAPYERDPFADLKNQVHMNVIGELGPSLSAAGADAAATRERVIATIRHHLSTEIGISREDRARLTTELTDDILGYGPLERLLSDDSITEIMVNGPGEIWIERQGRSVRDDSALYGRRPSATDHQQDRRADRTPHRRGVPDGRRPPARRLACQRDHPPVVPLRPAPHDPQVLEEAPHARRHGQHRNAVGRRRRVPAGCASTPSSTSWSAAAPAPARRRC